jgi:hypothetical protein
MERKPTNNAQQMTALHYKSNENTRDKPGNPAKMCEARENIIPYPMKWRTISSFEVCLQNS